MELHNCSVATLKGITPKLSLQMNTRNTPPFNPCRLFINTNLISGYKYSIKVSKQICLELVGWKIRTMIIMTSATLQHGPIFFKHEIWALTEASTYVTEASNSVTATRYQLLPAILKATDLPKGIHPKDWYLPKNRIVNRGCKSNGSVMARSIATVWSEVSHVKDSERGCLSDTMCT